MAGLVEKSCGQMYCKLPTRLVVRAAVRWYYLVVNFCGRTVPSVQVQSFRGREVSSVTTATGSPGDYGGHFPAELRKYTSCSDIITWHYDSCFIVLEAWMMVQGNQSIIHCL